MFRVCKSLVESDVGGGESLGFLFVHFTVGVPAPCQKVCPRLAMDPGREFDALLCCVFVVLLRHTRQLFESLFQMIQHGRCQPFLALAQVTDTFPQRFNRFNLVAQRADQPIGVTTLIQAGRDFFCLFFGSILEPCDFLTEFGHVYSLSAGDWGVVSACGGS
jgi:hypothetical protein